MKQRIIILCLIYLVLVINTLAQQIDFSINLTTDGGVHTNISSVTDKEGNIFVAGGTRENLKTTQKAYQKKYNGHSNWAGGDIFLMKFSPEGELIYSTYIGSTGSEYYCEQIALDDYGNIYVGFTTTSTDLPVSEKAVQKKHNGVHDHYITKFNNDCEYLSSTYFGGSGNDHWTNLVIKNDILYLFGNTMSLDFPTTKGAFQEKYKELSKPDSNQQFQVTDVSVTAFSLDLDKVLFSTCLGGENRDAIGSYCVDENGNVIIAGQTWSADFPTTEKCFDTSLTGSKDCFITMLNHDLSEVKYSTFFGGDSSEIVSKIIPGESNSVILTGLTNSRNFPVTQDALNKKYLGGKYDDFIMKFDLNSSKLLYSTFMGGSDDDNGLKITQTPDKQKFVLLGSTKSNDFPITADSFDPTYNKGKDFILLVLDNTLKNVQYSTFIGGSKNEGFTHLNLINNNELILTGKTTSPDFYVTKKHVESDSTGVWFLMKMDISKN